MSHSQEETTSFRLSSNRAMPGLFLFFLVSSSILAWRVRRTTPDRSRPQDKANQAPKDGDAGGPLNETDTERLSDEAIPIPTPLRTPSR